MIHKSLAIAAAVGLCCFAEPAGAAASAKAAQKPIKTLINAIRYGKFDLAAGQLSFPAMAQRLLGDAAGKFPAADQKELAQGLETIIRGESFPSGKEKFQYLDNVLYENPREVTGELRCKSTLVIHHDLKKTELVIDWVLVEEGGAYKAADMVLLGESTAAGIREDQIEPLLAEGGPAKVMEALRKKVSAVNARGR